YQRCADASVDRGRDAREAEIEGGLLELRARAIAVGRRELQLVAALVVLLAGHRLRLDELLTAREVALGERHASFGAFEIRASDGFGGGVFPGIDREQQLPFLDVAALAEMHSFEIAGDAGSNLDRIDRFDAARK